MVTLAAVVGEVTVWTVVKEVSAVTAFRKIKFELILTVVTVGTFVAILTQLPVR